MAERATPVRRALISVSEKRGVVEFARGLSAMGVGIVSTGGTARALREAGVDAREVSEVTGFPEVMGGRVKTLHPKVHGAILADRDDEEHARAMREHGIEPIDLVCINLYPFEQTVARGAGDPEAIEQIDIGGPAMIRAAAKNHAHVAVVTDPGQYERVLEEMGRLSGGTSPALRRELAAAAFARTSAYDAAIAAYLGGDSAFGETLAVSAQKVQDLRYGENPHQRAALYATADGGTLAGAEQLHGRELSYNNLLDADAALRLARDLDAQHPRKHAACVIKHTNPCGAAVAGSGAEAALLAHAGDPLAAYGGILATGSTVDEEMAGVICAEGNFFEVVIAPAYEHAALARLRERWKNVRLLQVRGGGSRGARVIRTIDGGLLVQEADAALAEAAAWEHRAGPAPGADVLEASSSVWLMAKHLTSNAIAIGGVDGGGVRLFGAGAGQMDRVAACRLAIEKAGERARGAIAASDAFFPFPDGPELLLAAGVSAIVHPGGSKRDAETFEACERAGVTCLTTGRRHFRH